jgi:tRNA(Ile2) C34 agmatinyltransferase TiaS
MDPERNVVFMLKQDERRIRQEFRRRQNRQLVAITAAMFIVLLSAVLYKRTDLLGQFSRGTLFGLQAITIAAFLGYTAYNWRCPSCDRHLGSDIHRQRCRKCGARLQ